MTKWKIYNEDAVEWAKNYQKGKFHALLCDAPYHLTSIVKRFGKTKESDNTLTSEKVRNRSDGYSRMIAGGFMGNTWDGGDLAFRKETWEAFGDVLYPGAFGMAFSASRNWHRMAVAIEDAGFVLHPTIFLWAYGQGFPKATNISKQIQPASEQKVVGKSNRHNSKTFGKGGGNPVYNTHPGGVPDLLEPTDVVAKRWVKHRYGLQALKPAVEPIIVFQKPYEGKPLDNIVSSGAGALNIDGGRISLASGDDSRLGGNGTWKTDKAAKNVYEGGYEGVDIASSPLGRWPANLILEEDAARALDAQTGNLKTTWISPEHQNNRSGEFLGELKHPQTQGYNDNGGASRFFYNVQSKLDESDPVYYCGKVSPKERQAGLEDKNVHPTLKPIDLCRYLATLLLPPVEYAPRRLFIPFSGVGSEMIGAGLAGWEQICGVEFDKENGYVDIAEKRLQHWLGEKK